MLRSWHTLGFFASRDFYTSVHENILNVLIINQTLDSAVDFVKMQFRGIKNFVIFNESDTWKKIRSTITAIAAARSLNGSRMRNCLPYWHKNFEPRAWYKKAIARTWNHSIADPEKHGISLIEMQTMQTDRANGLIETVRFLTTLVIVGAFRKTG